MPRLDQAIGSVAGPALGALKSGLTYIASAAPIIKHGGRVISASENLLRATRPGRRYITRRLYAGKTQRRKYLLARHRHYYAQPKWKRRKHLGFRNHRHYRRSQWRSKYKRRKYRVKGESRLAAML